MSEFDVIMGLTSKEGILDISHYHNGMDNHQ
jgi:hypothetical protein